MAFPPSTTLSLHTHTLTKTIKLSSITQHTNLKLNQNKPKTCLPTKKIQSFSLHTKIPQILSQNIAKALLGSLLFMASFTAKPTFAASQVQKIETLEEIRDTQMEKTENDDVNDEYMYEKILESDPFNVEALKVLVNVKMRNGKVKDALKFVEILSGIESDQVEWKLLKALCCDMLGDFSKAKSLFGDILKEMPLQLRALHGLAMVMHKNHEDAAAFDMLSDALQLAIQEKRVTEERNIKILIAQLHLVQGNFDKALEKYQELIDENPRDFRPYLCQGIIYSLQDKQKEAEAQFEIYRLLVPEEFPQRGFLEDVVAAAKSREQLEKEFRAAFSFKR